MGMVAAKTTWCTGLLVLVAACCAPRLRGTTTVEAPRAERAAASREQPDAAAPWAERIDAVMKQWDREDSPGCAVAVVRDGNVVQAKGYGMANLEHGVPIQPDTVFIIGSISKQFTASAVLLAAADGKLRLDDDVRVHLPALPKLGETPTTLRHLLHHTGGLRNYGVLLLLSGTPVHGVATVPEAMDLLARQRGRDFSPGAKLEYSNTGYVLLAQTVEHTTGQSLATYLDQRIFEPLGMESTQVLDNPQRMVPGRATGYARHGDGWRIDMTGWEPTGDGGMLSTVIDLAKWDANFYDPKVGGTRLLDGLLTHGTLNDGTPTRITISGTPFDYAAGLMHGSYRGQPTVWHAGGRAGYVAQFERFVALNTSIAILCNAAGARPDTLAHRIADIVLHEHLRDEPTPERTTQPAVQLTTAELDAWVGTYRETTTGEFISIARADDALVLDDGGERSVLVPTSPRTVRFDATEAVVRLHGSAPRRMLSAQGVLAEDRFEEVELREPNAREQEALVGRYYSAELDTVWTLSVSGDTLSVTGRAFDAPGVMASAIRDEYSVAPLGVRIRFTRDRGGDITGFALDAGSARGIRFDRMP